MRYADSNRRSTFVPVAVSVAALLMVAMVLSHEPSPSLTPSFATALRHTTPVKPVANSSRESAATLIREFRESPAERQEWYLAEMVRRRDPEFLRELTRIHRESREVIAPLRRKAELLRELLPGDMRLWDELPEVEEKAAGELWEIEEQIEEHRSNLELLTALRRLQNRPDPLGVFVTGFEPYPDVEWPEMPVLRVSLRNIDTLQESVGFRFGGDGRSGRAARFRCEVRNIRTGEVLAPLPPPSPIGGGQLHTGPLTYSDGWHTTLRLEDYVPQLDVGEYTVAVLYHNQKTIADRKSLDGLICSRSREYPLSVSKRTIYQSPETTAEMASLLQTVDRTQHVRIVEGQYGPWASEFIAADSPVGRVLTAGWQAVPALLNELDDESQSTMSRAHTLAMLFSITQQADPRGDRYWFSYMPEEKSAIGPFAFIRRGRGVAWHQDGRGIGGSGSFSFGSVETVGLPEPADARSDDGLRGGADDPETDKLIQEIVRNTEGFDANATMTLDWDLQTELVEQWKELRDRIEVVDPKADETDGRGGIRPVQRRRVFLNRPATLKPRHVAVTVDLLIAG